LYRKYSADASISFDEADPSTDSKTGDAANPAAKKKQ
jgi:hypothetical protein